MIDKIENEVGGDLHMIRVNGVVVGAFIGLALGIIRALAELSTSPSYKRQNPTKIEHRLSTPVPTTARDLHRGIKRG